MLPNLLIFRPVVRLGRTMITLTDILHIAQPPMAEIHPSLPFAEAIGGGTVTRINGQPIILLMMNCPAILPPGITDAGGGRALHRPSRLLPMDEVISWMPKSPRLGFEVHLLRVQDQGW